MAGIILLQVGDSGLYPGQPHRGSLPAPRMTRANRDSISNPACGLLVFNTDDDVYNIYKCGGINSWQTILDNSSLTNGRVLYSKNSAIAEDASFLYDDQNNRLSVEKVNVGTGTPPDATNVYMQGDGTNPMYFLNDLGVTSDGLKLIALFSRHIPGPGNAGFYAGYYVQGGDVSHTVLFAPGARDFGVTTYASGLGAENPTIFLKDSNQYVGIGTKIPSSKLHVFSKENIIGTFETNLAYGGISLAVPNIGIGNRAALSLGKDVSSVDSANFVYNHYDNSQAAAEIFIGTAPPTSTTSRIRVTRTQVQLQTHDVVVQQGASVPGTWARIGYKHGNDIDSPITQKLVLASRLRESNGRSDFSIAVNTLTDTTEPDELGDSAFFIDGLTARVGIHNTSPEATLDITGSHRARAATPPPYADSAKYVNLKWDREFIQRGQVNIPSFFEPVFEFFPSLLEIESFVDPDTWNIPAGNLADFGTLGGNWTASGGVYTTSGHRWGWGNQLVFVNSPTDYIQRKTGPLTPSTYRYLVVMMLDHDPSNDTTTDFAVLDLVPDTITGIAADHIRIRHYNNRLRIDNLTTGQTRVLTYFANGHRTVFVLELDPDADAIRGYSNRKAGTANYIRISTRTGFTLNDGTIYNVTIGAANGLDSMNMVVQFFAILKVKKTVQSSEIYRMMKKLSLWYS